MNYKKKKSTRNDRKFVLQYTTLPIPINGETAKMRTSVADLLSQVIFYMRKYVNTFLENISDFFSMSEEYSYIILSNDIRLFSFNKIKWGRRLGNTLIGDLENRNQTNAFFSLAVYVSNIKRQGPLNQSKVEIFPITTSQRRTNNKTNTGKG